MPSEDSKLGKNLGYGIFPIRRNTRFGCVRSAILGKISALEYPFDDYRTHPGHANNSSLRPNERGEMLSDGQDLGGLVLLAEARLGEMLEKTSKVPKQEPSRGDSSLRGREKSLPDGINKKQSHIAQELARHTDIIQEVVDEARVKN